jgi:hypothetical protein
MDPSKAKPNPFANIRPTQSAYARQPGSPASPPGSPGSPHPPGVPATLPQPAQPASPARPWERGSGAAAARPMKPWERAAAGQSSPGSAGLGTRSGLQPGTSLPGRFPAVDPVQPPVTAIPAQPASPTRVTGANLAADFLSEQSGGTGPPVSTTPGSTGLPRTQTQADSLAAAFLAEQEVEEQAATADLEGPRTPTAATAENIASPRGRPGMSPAVGEAEEDGVRVGNVSAEEEAAAAAAAENPSTGTYRALGLSAPQRVATCLRISREMVCDARIGRN